MGDYADMAIDDGIDSWNQPDDDDLADPMDGGYFRYKKRSLTCRYCGKSGFWWQKYEGGWRMFNEDGLHSCLKRDDGGEA